LSSVATSLSIDFPGLTLIHANVRVAVHALPGRISASVTFDPLDVKIVTVAHSLPLDAEQSTRRRILAATFVVLARDGRRKLQLSDVAAEAKISRPTLYRHFGSKEGLLEAFGLYEQDNFDSGIAAAMAGLSGADRLDSALRFIVNFQSTYSLGSLADIEPEHVLHQMKRVLPIMHERIARIIPGDQSDIAAAAVVRIAVCHYMIGGGSPDEFLAELRHAAGVDAPRRRMPRSSVAASR
jgi:AcrR family transcriptional regulator